MVDSEQFHNMTVNVSIRDAFEGSVVVAVASATMSDLVVLVQVPGFASSLRRLLTGEILDAKSCLRRLP
jgi:hypothetical protein